MKTNSFLVTSCTAIFLAALAAGVARYQETPGADFSANLAVAPEALAFDTGLDVRDEQGRTSSSPSAKRQLRQLFVTSLFALLMRPELPAMAEALALLKKGWDLASGVFGRAFAGFGFALDLWIQSIKRWRVAPALFLLAIAALVAFCGQMISRFVPRTESHLKQLSSTLIRC